MPTQWALSPFAFLSFRITYVYRTASRTHGGLYDSIACINDSMVTSACISYTHTHNDVLSPMVLQFPVVTVLSEIGSLRFMINSIITVILTFGVSRKVLPRVIVNKNI